MAFLDPGMGMTPQQNTGNPISRASATSRMTPTNTKERIPFFCAALQTFPPASAKFMICLHHN
jgi:hypothetical protein